ncbi:hypothetical protein, partial [Methylophilus sp.]|uniref:hypothetical protein n=1 Tax=Methylophilus sp. TaxID=29541 RepID=UPI0040376196
SNGSGLPAVAHPDNATSIKKLKNRFTLIYILLLIASGLVLCVKALCKAQPASCSGIPVIALKQ